MRKMLWIAVVAVLCLMLGCGKPPTPDAPQSALPAAPVEPGQSAPMDIEENAFLPGIVDGTAYQNTMLGYGCYLDGWSYADSAQLDALNGANGEMYLDMSAQSADGLQRVSVQFQQLALTDYLAALEARSPEALAEDYTEAGYENVSVEQTVYMLGSDSYDCLYMNGEIEGVPVSQRQMLLDCGDYTAVITATGYLGASPDEVLMRFYML